VPVDLAQLCQPPVTVTLKASHMLNVTAVAIFPNQDYVLSADKKITLWSLLDLKKPLIHVFGGGM
jgi:hypothetical protein